MATAKKTGRKATGAAPIEQGQVSEEMIDALAEALGAYLDDLEREQAEVLDSEDTKPLIQAYENAQAMRAYQQQKAEEVQAQLDAKNAVLAEVEADIAQDGPRLVELKQALEEAEHEAEQARIAHGIWINDARLGDVTQREAEHAKQKASRARQALAQHEEGREARLEMLEKRRAALASEVEALEVTLAPMRRAIDELGRQEARLQQDVFNKRLQVAQQRINERQQRAATLRAEAQELDEEARSYANRAIAALGREHPHMRQEAATLKIAGEDEVAQLLEAFINLLSRLAQDGTKLGRALGEQALGFQQVRDTLTIRDTDLAAYMTDPHAAGLQEKLGRAKWLLQTYLAGRSAV
ncbi:MAG TPA: hypothetical protein VKT82_20180 [Ktedonobacterales bacterium]|nr:hypothetical protein [Ktedonobacterales bacterium]